MYLACISESTQKLFIFFFFLFFSYSLINYLIKYSLGTYNTPGDTAVNETMLYLVELTFQGEMDNN